MVLRAATHRFDELSGESELAAGPDTPDRERWSWELRLLAADPTGPGRCWATTGLIRAQQMISLRRSDRSGAVLVLRGDPDLVDSSLRQEPVSGEIQLSREPGELTILVAAGGSVLVAGIHLLGELDALVVEGDDLLAFSVVPVPDGADGPDWGSNQDTANAGSATILAVARLVSRSREHLRWVP